MQEGPEITEYRNDEYRHLQPSNLPSIDFLVDMAAVRFALWGERCFFSQHSEIRERDQQQDRYVMRHHAVQSTANCPICMAGVFDGHGGVLVLSLVVTTTFYRKLCGRISFSERSYLPF